MEQGVSRNDSDKTCLSWIVDLLLGPIVAQLRNQEVEASHIDSCRKLFIGLNEAAKLVYGDSERYNEFLEMMGSLVVCAEAMRSTESSLAWPPSMIRDSLSSLISLGLRHPVSLALRYGEFGQELKRCAESIVRKNDKDQTAGHIINSAVEKMTVWLKTPVTDRSLDEPMSLLQSAQSTLTLFTKLGLDEQLADINVFCEGLKEALTAEQTRCIDCAITTFAPISEVLLSVAEADLSTEGADDTVAKANAADLADKAIAQVRDRAGKASPALESWKALSRFAKVCTSFNENLLSVVATVGSTFVDHGFAKDAALIQERTDALHNLLIICDSTSALSPNELPPKNYAEALNQWAMWSSQSKTAPTTASFTKPSLQKLVDATIAASVLSRSRAWSCLQHDKRDVVEFLSFSTSKVGALVLGVFKSRIAAFMNDAISSTAVAMVTECFSCPSEDAVKTASAGKALDIVSMMLQGEKNGKPIAEIMSNMTSDTSCPTMPTSWPHHPAIAMAKQFANLMNNTGEDIPSADFQTLVLGACAYVVDPIGPCL